VENMEEQKLDWFKLWNDQVKKLRPWNVFKKLIFFLNKFE